MESARRLSGKTVQTVKRTAALVIAAETGSVRWKRAKPRRIVRRIVTVAMVCVTALPARRRFPVRLIVIVETVCVSRKIMSPNTIVLQIVFVEMGCAATKKQKNTAFHVLMIAESVMEPAMVARQPPEKRVVTAASVWNVFVIFCPNVAPWSGEKIVSPLALSNADRIVKHAVWPQQFQRKETSPSTLLPNFRTLASYLAK